MRATYSALNPPPKDASPAIVEATRSASTDAFHLAVIVGSGLLVAGAGVNLVGLRKRETNPT
jgi:hypothetical protein